MQKLEKAQQGPLGEERSQGEDTAWAGTTAPEAELAGVWALSSGWWEPKASLPSPWYPFLHLGLHLSKDINATL